MVQSEKKQRAFRLRLQGKSYGEILRELNLSSKGTLSYWFHDFKIPSEARKRLASKIKLAQEKGLLDFNKNRTRKILKENGEIFQEAVDNTPRIQRDELLLIGASLYWGEGTLRGLKRGYQGVSFSNSDPRMVAVFMRYLREGLNISDSQIRTCIHIHPNISPGKAKNFWSRITGLPKHNFSITAQISAASKLKRKKNFLPYGTLSIRINRRQIFYRIRGYIEGIIRQVNGPKAEPYRADTPK